MKTAALFVCFLVTTALTHGGTAPPDSCKGRCSAEFKLMEDFSVLTKTSAIERVFGPARLLTASPAYHIDWYQSEQTAFLVVRRPGTQYREAVAVFRGTRPAEHIRIPYLGLILAGKRIATLADTPLSTLKQSCHGPVVATQDKRFWTPACYFGKPGTYMAYHFLFEEQACQATGSASDDFAEMECADETDITPVGALVTEWRPTINPPGAPAHLLLELPSP